MNELSDSADGIEFDTEKIRAVLEEALDFSKPKLDDSIIDKFVSQIIPVDNCRYRWDLKCLSKLRSAHTVKGRCQNSKKRGCDNEWGNLKKAVYDGKEAR